VAVEATARIGRIAVALGVGAAAIPIGLTALAQPSAAASSGSSAVRLQQTPLETTTSATVPSVNDLTATLVNDADGVVATVLGVVYCEVNVLLSSPKQTC
jgi:hypothetical protein